MYIYPRSATPLIQVQMWEGREQLAHSALGYANRVNIHALGIITSGVLDRFPGVRLVLWQGVFMREICHSIVLLLLLHHPLPAIMNPYAQQILGVNG